MEYNRGTRGPPSKSVGVTLSHLHRSNSFRMPKVLTVCAWDTAPSLPSWKRKKKKKKHRDEMPYSGTSTCQPPDVKGYIYYIKSWYGRILRRYWAPSTPKPICDTATERNFVPRPTRSWAGRGERGHAAPRPAKSGGISRLYGSLFDEPWVYHHKNSARSRSWVGTVGFTARQLVTFMTPPIVRPASGTVEPNQNSTVLSRGAVVTGTGNLRSAPRNPKKKQKQEQEGQFQAE